MASTAPVSLARPARPRSASALRAPDRTKAHGIGARIRPIPARRIGTRSGVNICRFSRAGGSRRPPSRAETRARDGRPRPTATDARVAARRRRRKRGWSRGARPAPVLARGLRRHAARGAPLGAPRQGAHDPLAPERRALPRPAPAARRAWTGTGSTPKNEWGHDVLWWLDRMVRSRRPLQEKLTLFWHDHFATSDQDTPLMLAQNQTLRRHALGSFPALLRAVTSDPAMLLFLSLADSDKEAPNENYARELMELFTLGRGYSERDIRQAARALTGFRVDWDENGPPRCYYEKEAHDAGVKRIFGHRGPLRLAGRAAPVREPPRARAVPRREALGLLRGHAHPRRARARRLAAGLPPLGPPHQAGGGARSWPTPRSTGSSTRPEWSSRRWCSSPARCGAPARASSATAGAGCSASMGQYPFHPPSVAGWDWGTAWLSSNSMRVRFDAANYLLGHAAHAREGRVHPAEAVAPRRAVARARRAVGDPWTSRAPTPSCCAWPAACSPSAS